MHDMIFVNSDLSYSDVQTVASNFGDQISGDRQLHPIRSSSHTIDRAPNQLDWVTDQVKS